MTPESLFAVIFVLGIIIVSTFCSYRDYRQKRKDDRQKQNDYKRELEEQNQKLKDEIAFHKKNIETLTAVNNGLKCELSKEQERCNMLAATEITPEFIQARKMIEEGKPFVLITGGAGTGKSHFIKHVLARNVNTAVVSPTGVAA
ncbi:MAG: hypothetical protein JXR78_07645, partial [Victivallales bacterium]|nr:hypothetical protein [Victivallales bacterium]